MSCCFGKQAKLLLLVSCSFRGVGFFASQSDVLGEELPTQRLLRAHKMATSKGFQAEPTKDSKPPHYCFVFEVLAKYLV